MEKVVKTEKEEKRTSQYLKSLNKNSSLNYENDTISYTFEWEKDRNEILSNYSLDIANYSKGIELCYEMIDKHRDQNIFNIIKDNEVKLTQKDEKGFRNFCNSYQHLEDYICNIFLLVFGYIQSKSRI
jgi:hypothetical protein